MSHPNRRTIDLERRQISPAIVLGGAVAWLFIGSTVVSLLAM
jgi:hypothetical protein